MSFIRYLIRARRDAGAGRAEDQDRWRSKTGSARLELDRIDREGKRDLALILCLGVLALVVLALLPAPR